MKIEYGRLSRRARLERGQHPDHLQPPPDGRCDDAGEPKPDRASRTAIDEAYGFATRAVHAGAQPDPVTGSRNMPIHQTTSYVFDDVDHAAALFNLQTFGYIYSRMTNPTVAALEERVAALEGGRAAVAAASGHAAQLLALLHAAGARRPCRGGAPALRRLADPVAAHVPAARLEAPLRRRDRHRRRSRAAIEPQTKAVFVESLANPGGVVADLEALADVAHEASIPLIVDNTLATPYLCRPFEWGADLVVHSLTKFLSGHGTSMGGILVESGQFDWKRSGKFPFARRPGPGVPRARLLRDVRRLRVLDEGAGRRAARPRTGPVADQRVPHPDRHRDAAAADGAPRRERARRRGVPRRAPAGRLGVVRGPAVEPVRRARARVPAEGRRVGVHVRRPRAASTPASGSWSRSTCGRTSPTSATPGA